MPTRTVLSEAATRLWLKLSVTSRDSGSRRLTLSGVDFAHWCTLHELCIAGVITQPVFDHLAGTAVVWIRCRMGWGDRWIR